MKKILSFILVLCLGITCGLTLVGCGDKSDAKSEATSIIEFSVNPEVQVILDQDDNVMNINYLSAETQMVFSRTNFIGLSAKDVSDFFAKVVSDCGKIDLAKGYDETTDGTIVFVKIYCKDDTQFNRLKGETSSAINEYFKFNGIVAGAQVTRLESLKDSLSKIDATVDTTGLTNDDMFKLLAEKSNQFENIHFSLRESSITGIENVKKEFEIHLEENQRKADELYSAILQIQKQYDNYSNEFLINKIALDEIEAKIDKLQAERLTYLTEIENSDIIIQDKIAEYLDEVRKDSVSYYEQDIATATEMFENFKSELEAHQIAFYENFDSIKEKIDTFQQSLNED